ncbi:MAG TPA: CPBP family glutamic-type intramembrane protease [Candidatus Krumholzibacteria bacterium]|nr:CPBP family glutamic-type intramembrane protease [Candidatus Krumholzibacteria bacterium]
MDDAARGARDIRRVVLVSSLGFCALLTALAWILLRVRGTPFATVFVTPTPIASALTGVVAGAAGGAVCVAVVLRVRALARLRRLAGEALAGIEPRGYHLALVACAAGWGEELLFRGALQPIAGIWLTSAAFVLLHGALRHRNRGGAAFAAFLFAASSGLGWLAREQGLAAAMLAHAAYDLVVLAGIRAAATNY